MFNTPRCLVLLSIILMIMSWCIPAYDDAKGYEVVYASLLFHIFIIPIPIVFPVWANVTYYYSIFLFFKGDLKTKRWSYITLAVMVYGLLSISLNTKPVLAGAYIWVISGLILCIANYIYTKAQNSRDTDTNFQ
jgi:hypothetical protein